MDPGGSYATDLIQRNTSDPLPSFQADKAADRFEIDDARGDLDPEGHWLLSSFTRKDPPLNPSLVETIDKSR